MKYALERHAFAPELNKLHIQRHGAAVIVNVPGCDTLKAAKQKLGHGQPRRWATHAVVTVVYPEPWTDLNRLVQGVARSRQQALDHAEELRIKAKGGKLFDGRILPPGVVSVKTKSIWV